MLDGPVPEQPRPGRAQDTHLAFLLARRMEMGRFASTAAGIFLGGAYAWACTLIVTKLQPRALATYSFLAGVPLVLALLPYLRSKRPSGYNAFFKPLASILLCALALWVTGFESGLCLVLIGLPLVSLTALFALVLFLFRRARVAKDIRDASAISVVAALLLPFALALAETRWLPYASDGEVSFEVGVRVPPSRIWPGILRVSPFSAGEMPASWLQRLGVPRPVYATLDNQREGGLREGHFEGGLTFLERVATYRENQELGLSVRVDPTTLGANATLAHALTTGLLSLDDVRYRLVPSAEGAHLILGCRYTLRTTVAPYGHAVARVILVEFERGLLRALQRRFEGLPVAPGAPLIAQSR